MRFPLVGITVSVLGVACSAPEESAIFEDTVAVSAGGASSPTSTSTSGNEGGAGAEASDAGGNSSTSGGSGGNTTTSNGGGSTSTSVGGASGSGGATTGMGTTGMGTTGMGGTGGTATTSSSTSSGGVAGSGGCSEEVCDGADNDCDDSVDDDVCPDGCVGASYEKHTYLFCDGPGVVGNNEASRSWQQATQFCANRAGFRLTSIETEAENAFIYQTLVTLNVSGDVWMGATDQEGEGWWTWASSEDPDEWVAFYDEEAREPIEKAFNDWREGEPNDDGGEDCGIFEDLSSDEWAWDDRDCDLEYDLFVCESTD